jgi:hypothetical protein
MTEVSDVLNKEMEITPESIEAIRKHLGDRFETFCDFVFGIPQEALEELPEEYAWKVDLIEKFKKAVSH